MCFCRITGAQKAGADLRHYKREEPPSCPGLEDIIRFRCLRYLVQEVGPHQENMEADCIWTSQERPIKVPISAVEHKYVECSTTSIPSKQYFEFEA